MTTWDDRTKAAREELKLLLSRLNDATHAEEASRENDEDNKELFRRIKRIHTRFNKQTKRLRRDLLPIQRLPNLSQTVEAVISSLTASEAAETTHEKLDNLLHHWSLFLHCAQALNPKDQTDNLNDEVDDLRLKLENSKTKLDSLLQKTTETETRLTHTEKNAAALSDSISRFHQDLQETISNFNSKLQGTLSKWVEDFERLKTTTQSEIRDNASKQTQEFAAAEASRTKDFAEFKAELLNGHQEIISDHKEALAHVLTHADSIVEEIQSKLDKAAELVQITSNIALTGHYRKIADKEGKTADSLRFSAGLLFAGSALAVLGILIFAKSDTAIQMSLLRLSAAFALVLPGLYLANESKQHRKMERIAKRHL